MTRLEEIEARKVEIKSEVETTEEVEKLEELNEEVDALNEEAEQITEAQKEEEVAETLEEKPEAKAKAKEVSMEVKKEENVMEMRNTKEYIDAYAEYIKSGKEEEIRTLLTENVSGTIAVPDFVLDEVKTAWDNNDLLSLVRKTNVKGNLKVQFEISGSDAVIHTEGAYAVEEEELIEGIVELSPVSIKKWISISDEVMDLRGEEFLRYIYDELTYRIAKKAADTLISKITALTDTASSSAPAVGVITKAPAVGTIAEAIGNLSDEASNPTIVMNKLTYSAFKEAQYANNYGVDPFEGLKVIFNNSLPAYSSASTNDIYMIVGDFGYGSLANFPNGEGIDIKFDELSRKKEDLVEILGREYVALGVIANKAFVQVKKPAAI